MNETLETIFTRRSVRSFTSRQIAEEELGIILKAAMAAPSANNLQCWHFSVIQNKPLLTEMELAITKGIMLYGSESTKLHISLPDFKTFYNAPTVIVISTDKQNPKPLDVGAAAENILLASWSLGIGSCYIGSSAYMFKTEQGEDLKKRMGIPDDYAFCASVALGYVHGDVPPMPQRKSDVITFVR